MNKSIFLTTVVISTLYSFSCQSYQYSDEYLDCIDGDYDRKSYICLKEEQARRYREIDEYTECLSSSGYFKTLQKDNISIKQYIEDWKKYSDNLCHYFRHAFEYLDGKSIKTPQENERKYEECRMIEIGAMVRRLGELCQDVRKKLEIDALDRSM